MNEKFPKRLRDLRKLNGYTQKDFSEIMKIKQTTISNYEKGLRFPDVEKLNKMANIFKVSVDYLIGRNEEITLTNNISNYKLIEENYKEILEHLLKCNKDEAKKTILNIYKSGVKIEVIYFNLLEKILKEIGILWEIGKIDVWNEHYISESILDIMREIKGIQKNREKNNVTLIALTAGGEQHNIGIKMIADLLEVDGYRVTYLGSNVPTKSLLDAIKRENPRIVAISVTITYNIESAKNSIKAIRNTFGEKSPLIVVGGMAFDNFKNVCEELEADCYCKNLNDIKKLIE